MSRIARSLTFIVVALTFVSANAQNTKQQSFVSGGRVKIQLEAGDYKIVAGANNTLRVSWYADSVERSDVKVDIQTYEKAAHIQVRNTPHKNFHATIELPAKSDLFIRLTAGDLHIARIIGSKDIESRAGDVNIDVVDPNDYHHVDASVIAGDLSAPAFKVSKGGLFRSLQWTGPGTYSLHAHLLAGDLLLKQGSTENGN